MHEVPKMNKLLRIAKAIYFMGAVLIGVFFSFATMWAFDRDPPFELYEYTINMPHAGAVMEINGHVKRDLSRSCSVKFTRLMYDSYGRRFWESDETNMSAAALEEMNAKMKGGLKLLIPVPDYTPPGKVTLSTVLQYKCNPLHAFWPIDVVMNVETTVLPSQTK